MSYIEPTYLRYIYDGLAHGKIHSENAAELPYGLIGLYEELFDDCQAVQERQGLLERFAIWALVKKEVSADFVSEVLEQPVEEIREFISTYSSWFNSPENGKYQLYHERLKVYLQQKLSDKEINSQLEKLIVRLEKSIQESKSDEFELYGLEYLSLHLSIVALLGGDGKRLVEFAYDKGNWERQIKISKGYTWTKNSLEAVMVWAYKHNEEEVIECSLQLVDLHYREHNAALQIIAFVSRGDFESALKRIEDFGGKDKDGMRRKFVLYMLCLIELTLLDSKEKSYAKEGIDKLLMHLDDQLPVDHTLLDWGKFFPSYLVFQMACEWRRLGFDYMMVYRRAKNWLGDWLSEEGPFNDLQMEVLLESILTIEEESAKSSALKDISIVLVKQGRIEESFEVARGISHEGEKSSALNAISGELAKQGSHEQATLLLEESLKVANGISNQSERIRAFCSISFKLAEQGRNKQATQILLESLVIAKGIGDEFERISAFFSISIELAKQGRIEESLKVARSISSGRIRVRALGDISLELAKQGSNEQASLVLRESLEVVKDLNELQRSLALSIISSALAKQGRLEESLEIVRGIGWRRNDSLKDISIVLAKQGRIEKSLEVAQKINDQSAKSIALNTISIVLAEQGKIGESLEVAMRFDFERNLALNTISTEFAKQGNYEDAALLLMESLKLARGLSEQGKSKALRNISIQLAKQGRIEESLEVARGISKSMALYDISIELAKRGKIEESLEIARGISDESEKSMALRDISIELAKQSKLEESLEVARGISYESKKSWALSAISIEFAKQGRIEESLKVANGISDQSQKSSALNAISGELAKQGSHEQATLFLEESLEVARGIRNEWSWRLALCSISIELAKQGRNKQATQLLQESLANARAIFDGRKRVHALGFISIELARHGNNEQATQLLKESLEVARGISDESKKSMALGDISVELAKLGRIKESLEVARGIISHEWKKSMALRDISIELAKQGRIEESLEIARGISDEWEKSRALSAISVELARQENLKLGERIGLEIKAIGIRHKCWKEMAEEIIKKFGWDIAMQKGINLKNEEAQIFYFKECVEAINVRKADLACLKKVLPHIIRDSFSLKELLLKYALNEVFYCKYADNRVIRLAKTFDIQWAIDIKNQDLI